MSPVPACRFSAKKAPKLLCGSAFSGRSFVNCWSQTFRTGRPVGIHISKMRQRRLAVLGGCFTQFRKIYNWMVKVGSACLDFVPVGCRLYAAPPQKPLLRAATYAGVTPPNDCWPGPCGHVHGSGYPCIKGAGSRDILMNLIVQCQTINSAPGKPVGGVSRAAAARSTSQRSSPCFG